MADPLHRRCAWCRAQAIVPLRTHCDACGGPLPTFSRQVLREHPELSDGDSALMAIKPGAPSRSLPRGYALRTVFGHFLFWFGVLFFTIGALACVIGLPIGVFFWPILPFALLFGGIFSLIGALTAGLSTAQRLRRVRALRHGHVAQGTVQNVHLYSEDEVTLFYTFAGPAGVARGQITTAESTSKTLVEDDRLWVVFMPKNPASNTPWPPR